MNHLTSKVQYRDFEKGEFTEIAERNLPETMALMLAYPWIDQRSRFVVGLTGPGVVIQDNRGNYLKLALFYHSKFVVYYCNGAGRLYQKTLEKPEDVMDALTTFFSSSDHPPEGLLFQKRISENRKEHFQTRDFRYSVQDQSIWQLVTKGATLFHIFFGIFLIAMVIPGIRNYNRPGSLIFLLILFLFIFLVGGGVNLLLLYRYYISDRNTVITLSRGLPDFYFGTEAQQAQYNKRDIVKIELKRRTNNRSPIRDFAVYTICMADGARLPFTSLLIPPDQLREKMTDVRIEEMHRFAWPSFKAL